ncbi:MAG: hypothetical protein P4L83_07410 [Nevskia sp.]|nr:hypothetical protein [Nevskia sp.]
MEASLFGRFKQGLHSGSYSRATMTVTSELLSFEVGIFFRDRYAFTPGEVRRFHKTDAGVRIYHSRADCLSPIVFKVDLFRSQNLTLKTIKRMGFVPRGHIDHAAR